MDSYVLHRIWREHVSRLNVLSRRVQEGRDVMAASEFARFLFFSGLVELFKANPQDEPFKVDGAFFEWKINELIEQCNERFKSNNESPDIKKAELESLHDKLDKMAGYLARLSAAPVVGVPRSAAANEEPDLKVISGGLNGEAGCIAVANGGH